MAYLGTGTVITVDSESESASLLFAEVISIKLPTLESGKVDVTHMTSVDYREYLTKELLDVGEMEVEMNFDPDVDPATYTGGGHSYSIIFPNGAVWSWTGGLTKYDATIPLEDKMTVTVAISVETGFSVAPAS